MKTAKECYECLERLAFQAASLATGDEEVRQRAGKEGLSVLEQNFSPDEVPIAIATKIHQIIREVTRNPDPYLELKEREIAVAKELYHQINPKYRENFTDLLKLSALGNTIDFFRPVDSSRKEMEGRVDFVIDDSPRFEVRLKEASQVLYLADNAGEVFFDLPLLRWMRQFGRVTYVVKASPVQDDVTAEDVRRAGLEAELGEIITTGTATPGIVFSLASLEFRQRFEAADLIFAKGMGYYESLSELPPQGKILYCLKAKCRPVADSVGVPLNSYVAMIR